MHDSAPTPNPATGHAPPLRSLAAGGDVDRGRQADAGVGQRLSDEAREAAIVRAGQAMEKAYADYQRSGNFADVGRAHHHLWQMGKLIEGRSPEMVAHLERQRGLDVPACANEARA